jgi:hypothetical protein
VIGIRLILGLWLALVLRLALGLGGGLCLGCVRFRGMSRDRTWTS